jgi:hypothetical protein
MLGWNLTDDFARNKCTLYTFWLAPTIHLFIYTSSANIKIFNGQGPDGYMRNVVYKEVLEM